MTRGVAVLVSSCDHFSDAWAPFFYFWKRYWPDCPYPVYLLSNYGRYEDPAVTSLAVGREKSWADNLLRALEQMECQTLIYFQEDYFLNRPVETEKLARIVTYFEDVEAVYCGLFPVPAPEADYQCNGLGIGRVPEGAPMRASLQAALWNRRALMDLVRSGESAWDMEKLGTERSRTQLFLRVESVDQAPLGYYATAIKRGCWEWGAVKLCLRHGIRLDLSQRPLRSRIPKEAKKQKWVRRWKAWRNRWWPTRPVVVPLTASDGR
ncbi:MAG: hypothetical protein ACFCUX_01040 [Candidatus Methylacidiphilales bacterium]